MTTSKAAPSKVSVNVYIMEKEYQIQCGPGDKQHLIQAAVDVDTRMRAAKNIGANISSEKAAVLTALNLANELQGAADNTDILTAVSNSVIDMSARIDKALDDKQPKPEQEILPNIQSQ